MLIRSCRRWRQSQPTATRIVFAIEYHPHGALANFGGKLHGLCHGSIPSSAGASVKPKASQASICFDNVIYCIWLIYLIKTPMGCFAHFLGMVFMRWNRERFFMTCGVFEKEPLPTPGAFLCSGHGLAFAVGWFACGWFPPDR